MADGKGCQCAAYSSSDCGCPDVDWTPQEIYDLRDKVKILQEQINVASAVEETFWDALKKLNLSGVDVHNPGRHFTEALAEKDALLREVEEWLRDSVDGYERELARRIREALK